MYQQDYILRLIEMMGAAFRRMLEAIRENRPAEALETYRDSVGELFDMDPGLVDAMAGPGLVALLGMGGRFDAVRARLLGELLYARSEALYVAGDMDGVVRDRERAADVLRAAFPHADDDEVERISELLRWLDEPPGSA